MLSDNDAFTGGETCRGPKRGELSVETHHYLSSLEADEKRLAGHIRAHWGVESFLHVLDLTFGGDHCRVRERTVTQNFCILREMSAQTLRNHLPKQTIRAKRKRAALDPGFPTELLTSISHNFGA
jgi:hypothetical protein